MADESVVDVVAAAADAAADSSVPAGWNAEQWAYAKKLRDEAAQTRKKLEAKVKDEEKAREKALAENNEFKTLAETLRSKLDPLEAEIGKYREAEAKRKQALLEKIPEAKRGLYESVPVEVLEDVVATIQAPPATPAAKPGPDTLNKSFDDMSEDERETLKKNDIKLYRTKFRESYKKRNGVDPPAHFLL